MSAKYRQIRSLYSDDVNKKRKQRNNEWLKIKNRTINKFKNNITNTTTQGLMSETIYRFIKYKKNKLKIYYKRFDLN